MLKRSVVALPLVACASPAPRPEPVLQVRLASYQSVTAARDPVPAFTLTASDGTGLRLTTVDAKAVVEGPLAFTELHLRFSNPEPRVREGTFSITLPPRAAISRFAMEEADHLKEAEVVAKLFARQTYEDFLRRRIDPALLETAPGNQFTARVFPIAANGEKHLVVSYSQELSSDGYVLPLR